MARQPEHFCPVPWQLSWPLGHHIESSARMVRGNETSFDSIFLLNKIFFSIIMPCTCIYCTVNTVQEHFLKRCAMSIHKTTESKLKVCMMGMGTWSKPAAQCWTSYTIYLGSGQSASINFANANHFAPGAQEQSITPGMFSRTFIKTFF